LTSFSEEISSGIFGGGQIRSSSHTSERQAAAGAFLVIGWEGTLLSEPLELLERYRPAGLIFFRRNYPPGGGPELTDQLLAMKARAKELGLPELLIALDNEGGLVKRLPEPFTQLPKASDSQDLALIESQAEASGRELSALGFNLNLAPVLDVDTIGGFMRERCFGASPGDVLSRAEAFARGFAKASVACCAKHFPGLGAAEADPHEVLPQVGVPIGEIDRVHLAPFRELLGREIAMVMTTHCRYPALDPDNPATFSDKIIALLREGLHFGGPALSDDLEMGAVLGLGLGPAAAAAIEAGHDLALVCRKPENIEAAMEGLCESIAKGRIPASRLNDSRRRVRTALSVSEGVKSG
jgi:beta-N-acetylhexosaminidase